MFIATRNLILINRHFEGILCENINYSSLQLRSYPPKTHEKFPPLIAIRQNLRSPCFPPETGNVLGAQSKRTHKRNQNWFSNIFQIYDFTILLLQHKNFFAATLYRLNVQTVLNSIPWRYHLLIITIIINWCWIRSWCQVP